MNKVVIIGCGNVGISYAFALLNQQTKVNELVLIDINEKKALGEAMDLNHGLAYSPSKIKIKVGEYKDCGDANIVCIAAGASQNPGETRMDLIYKNSKIFKSIVSNVMDSGFNGIFLVATNPLDVMTYLVWKYSGLPNNKIIGSGTSLDTARLRYVIGEKVGIDPKNIHAYVIGEHGDSEFVPWSNANIGLQPITDFLDKDELDSIVSSVRDSAYDIINLKGSTCYGIGMSLARITNAIFNDENSIISVSSFDKNNELFVGGPTIINSSGVLKRVFCNLNEEETSKLQHSIDVIKNAIDSIEL